ncbi:hypothetical protein M413DRAFT_431291 [Hebeloma cylindrosporum]|uniref:MYND-type domain-containing protein n=1 Tax=Hebeloma cylindrosporum TaxID=76867 RepID=A0A0C3BV29_HEBCY|nr:hypothetical protein M413DRAFT_431291 [Hebeloma cylindrosporum h7]
MDELIQRFSTLATPETMSKMMANAQRAMDHDMSTQTKNISMLPPDPRTANGDINDPARFLQESMSRSPRFPPPDTVPCANVQVAKYEACDKSGTQACSGCRIVSYCSKECQKAHWKSHKGDCKNPLRSEAWTPAWSREHRLPLFITTTTLEKEFLDKNSEEFSVGLHLWGNTPSAIRSHGIWLQTDYADPLEGWDVTAILKAGKAHGAQSEDIYGCLYFFLSEQLRAFAQRIREFKLSFSLFTSDARRLPEIIHKGLTSGYGVARSVRFDRIEVSNILDANYVGIQDVLLNWSPLLARTPTAVIMGCFMNWFTVKEDGRATNAGRIATRTILKCVINKTLLTYAGGQVGHPEDAAYLLTDDMDALYENSKPFSAYLKKQGLDEILRKAKLQLRKKHTIVPHRTLAPLEGPANALPVFRDDESWYNHFIDERITDEVDVLHVV